MKITLNLSPAESVRDRLALAWAIPAIMLGLVSLVLLSRASIREYRQYRAISTQLAEVKARMAERQGQETAIRGRLDDPQYRDLLKRARFVNDLIESRQLSLSAISSRIAGLLPGDAHLTGLALASPKKPSEGYMVRMGITARNEDAVETFVNDLEDAPDFKDVSILNQGFQEEMSQPDQVNIVCTAHYLPGVNIDADEEADKEKPIAQKPTPNHKSHR